MKLFSAQAENYRNILDSNAVEIGQSTCLVGKNEAGKSAFLKALEGVRSTDASYIQYNKITNYPRQNLSEYSAIYGHNEAVVMTVKWKLETADVKAIEAELGVGTIKTDIFEVSKTYESRSTTWSFLLDQVKVLAHLIAKCGLASAEKEMLAEVRTTAKAHEALSAISTRTAPQDTLFQLIGKFRDHRGDLHATDILSNRMPKFM